MEQKEQLISEFMDALNAFTDAKIRLASLNSIEQWEEYDYQYSAKHEAESKINEILSELL